MRYVSLLITSAVLVLAGCGSDPAEAPSSGSDDQPTAEELAIMQQDGGGEALKISDRSYSGGSTHTKVSGFFEVDGNQDLNKPASVTNGGQTWLQYGDSGAQELSVTFTNSEDMAESGVTIGVGPYTAVGTSTSGECQPKIDVTAANVSGHFSCHGVTAYNKDNSQMGKVNIEVDFNASS